MIQLQQSPQLISQEALKLEKPFRDVLSLGEGRGSLYPHIDESLDMWLPQGSWLDLG